MHRLWRFRRLQRTYSLSVLDLYVANFPSFCLLRCCNDRTCCYLSFHNAATLFCSCEND